MGSTEGRKMPCVNEPRLKAFDKDGDGILSFEELRGQVPDNPRLEQVLLSLEGLGVSGIRYTGCEDADPATKSGPMNDLATLVARAAVQSVYEPGSK
jgi:hypothetical protein